MYMKIDELFDLTGKVAVVTGGGDGSRQGCVRDSGIGRGIGCGKQPAR